MRKQCLVLLLIGLAAALTLGSCDEELIKKGGTIEVTNGYKVNGVGFPTYVIVVEGAEFDGALEDLKSGGGELLGVNEKKVYTFNEDGVYTVVAVPPLTGFYKPVWLTLGSKEKVTIE